MLEKVKKALNYKIILDKYIFIVISTGLVLLALYIVGSELIHRDEQNLEGCTTLLARGTLSKYLSSKEIETFEDKVKKANAKTNKEKFKICESSLKEKDDSSPTKIYKIPLKIDTENEVKKIIEILQNDINNGPPAKIYELRVKPKSLRLDDYYHTYLLENGKVLIYQDGRGELFNPKTNTFELVIDKRRQHESRYGEIFNLPDKQVYVDGYAYDPKKNILYNGNKLVDKINKVERLYNNNIGSQLCKLSGVQFLVAFGQTFFSSLNDRSLGYQYFHVEDLLNNKTYPKVKLNIPREDFSVAELKDGQILIIGGSHYTKKQPVWEKLDTIELYNPKLNSIKIVAKTRIPTSSSFPSILLKDGRVLIIEGDEYNDLLEIFDPKTKKMQLVANISLLTFGPFRGAKLLPDTGQVFILYYNAFVLDLEKGTITTINNPRLRYDNLNFTPLGNNKVLLTGGELLNDYIGHHEVLRQPEYPAILDLNVQTKK